MGVKVAEDDPAFLLVEMNRLELEEAVSAVGPDCVKSLLFALEEM
jgi:hypothetical protein